LGPISRYNAKKFTILPEISPDKTKNSCRELPAGSITAEKAPIILRSGLFNAVAALD
jgi:hypothetical protein